MEYRPLELTHHLCQRYPRCQSLRQDGRLRRRFSCRRSRTKQKTSVAKDGVTTPGWNFQMKFNIDEAAALKGGLPVYFGDAGSREILHNVGAERACAAAITLDTPNANYRTVWALSKYFPNVKTFVRAHDVDHGINSEKAGVTAVVPETLEPSLQLAAAVLGQPSIIFGWRGI